MLRSIERRIEGLVERTFGRAFRSNLQPVELARKLAREMEQHKTISVSRIYVPNDFVVYLAPVDREQFGPYEHNLTAELATYLDQHARGEGLAMVAAAVVRLETDDDLRIGEFGIACQMSERVPEAGRNAARRAPSIGDRPADAVMSGRGPALPAAPVVLPPAAIPVVSSPEIAADPEIAVEPEIAVGPEPPPPEAEIADEPEVQLEPEPEPRPESTPEPEMTPEPPAPPVDWDADPGVPLPAAAPLPPPPDVPNPMLEGVSGTQVFSPVDARDAGVPRETMMLIVRGVRHRVTKRITKIGRSRDCDLMIADPNVSRLHAEIRHIELDYFLVDQNSTNGVQVNGGAVKRHALADGDVITLGTSEIRIELS